MSSNAVVIQQAGNITCDFIKANKNIEHGAVISFLGDVLGKLRGGDLVQSIEFPDPPNFPSKMTISFAPNGPKPVLKRVKK